MINKDMKMSPSAFIPFCEFGGNMSSVGVNMRQFDYPVCNCFQAKLFNDQQCYEVDLDRFSNNHYKDKELKLGFYFMMDYNEDRQVQFLRTFEKPTEFSFGNTILKSDEHHNAFIYLDTVGKSMIINDAIL